MGYRSPSSNYEEIGMAMHLTVVYTIHDNDAFDEERKRLQSYFKSSDGEPWAITAMSLDHEMQRLHWIESALDEGDMDAIDAAISHINIGAVKSLNDLVT
jgi:hypothetical protein